MNLVRLCRLWILLSVSVLPGSGLLILDAIVGLKDKILEGIFDNGNCGCPCRNYYVPKCDVEYVEQCHKDYSGGSKCENHPVYVPKKAKEIECQKCRKFHVTEFRTRQVRECYPVFDEQCSTSYSKHCKVREKCTETYKTVCHQDHYGYQQECQQVPSQSCYPETVCHNTPQTKCYPVRKQNCKNVDKEEPVQVLKHQCLPFPAPPRPDPVLNADTCQQQNQAAGYGAPSGSSSHNSVPIDVGVAYGTAANAQFPTISHPGQINYDTPQTAQALNYGNTQAVGYNSYPPQQGLLLTNDDYSPTGNGYQGLELAGDPLRQPFGFHDDDHPSGGGEDSYGNPLAAAYQATGSGSADQYGDGFSFYGNTRRQEGNEMELFKAAAKAVKKLETAGNSMLTSALNLLPSIPLVREREEGAPMRQQKSVDKDDQLAQSQEEVGQRQSGPWKRQSGDGIDLGTWTPIAMVNGRLNNR